MDYKSRRGCLQSLVLLFLIVQNLIVQNTTASSSNVSADCIVVVGNISLPVNEITLVQAKQIWLAKTKSVGSVSRVTVVDSASELGVAREFHSCVTAKTPSQLKAYWGRLMFSGRDFPPQILDSDQDVINWVTSTPGGLGYVRESSVQDSVKVLLRIL